MPKEIVLYNLSEEVTDEQYMKYVNEEKGPLLVGLPATKSFTLLRIKESLKGEIPYNYVGILEYDDPEARQVDASSEVVGNFMQTWAQKVTPEFHVLQGVEVYSEGK